jgi:2'-5' RNA ligase
MKIIASILLCLFSTYCNALSINAYIKYEDTQLKKRIQHLNAFLEDKGIFEKYEIRPFIENYPLHTTLYLSEYETQTIPQIIKTAKRISTNWHQFTIKATTVSVTSGNYVMMDIELKPRQSGLNHIMQEYSDETVMELAKLRDTSAKIPDWAQNIPSKLHAFKRYGSPNVFFEFAPHFTLMAKTFKSQQTAKHFQDDMNYLLTQYEQSHPSNQLQIKALGLGLGYANEYGQVTQEITSFKLAE